ncbi:hypothetical protein MMC30_005394 [Trapelia coarctata]|nr:hypothetical protein [Trapelia coarctata]
MYPQHFGGETSEDADSARYSKRARYEVEPVPPMQARRGGITESEMGSRSRTDSMLQRGFQMTGAGANTAIGHPGLGSEVPRSIVIDSYMDPNLGYVEVRQTRMVYEQPCLPSVHPAHIGYDSANRPVFGGTAPPVIEGHEHSNAPAFGDNVHQVHIGYQHENPPVFGGMEGPPRMGHEHPNMRGFGGMVHPAHVGEHTNLQAPGDIVHQAHMGYQHGNLQVPGAISHPAQMAHEQRNLPASGDMVHPAYMGYDPRNPQASGSIVGPGHVGYGQPHFEISEGMVHPVQMSHEHRNPQAFGDAINPPQMGYGHEYGNIQAFGDPPYLNYQHPVTGGNSARPAQMGCDNAYPPAFENQVHPPHMRPRNPPQQNRNTIETLHQGNQRHPSYMRPSIPLQQNSASIETFHQRAGNHILNNGANGMNGTGVDIDGMTDRPTNHVMGHNGRPLEGSGVGTSAGDAGKQMSKTEEQERPSGVLDSQSGARDTNVRLPKVDEGPKGQHATQSSGQAGAVTGTIARGDRENGKILEKEREGEGTAGADRHIGGADRVRNGAEEATPMLIQGGESIEGNGSPITPELVHKGNSSTRSKTVQGKGKGKSQDKTRMGQGEASKTQGEASKTQEDASKTQEVAARVQDETTKTQEQPAKPQEKPAKSREEPAKTVKAPTESAVADLPYPGFEPLPFEMGLSCDLEDMVLPRMQTPELPPAPKVPTIVLVSAADDDSSAIGASASAPLMPESQGEAWTEQGVNWDDPELAAFVDGVSYGEEDWDMLNWNPAQLYKLR